MYEQVRKSLEMCSIQKDIEYFVNQRKTGQIPPGEWGGGVGSVIYTILLAFLVRCH